MWTASHVWALKEPLYRKTQVQYSRTPSPKYLYVTRVCSTHLTALSVNLQVCSFRQLIDSSSLWQSDRHIKLAPSSV
jgi:hypothetical protein